MRVRLAGVGAAEVSAPLAGSSVDGVDVRLRVRLAGAGAEPSVCTGALELGAAGLLKGSGAATHWASMEFLEAFGATPVNKRVCIDRNRITGGGVTAGIDFGLLLAEVLSDRMTAEKIQLYMEYIPEPPFTAGSPDTAPPAVVKEFRSYVEGMLKRRGEAVSRAAQKLSLPAAR